MSKKNDVLEQRIAALEAEVARLKEQLNTKADIAPEQSGWQSIVGTFANDPIYEAAMRLGREYRESLRPKPRKTSRTKVAKRKKS